MKRDEFVAFLCWIIFCVGWLNSCGGSRFGICGFVGNWLLVFVFAKFDVRQKKKGFVG